MTLLALGCIASVATSKDPGFDTAGVAIADTGFGEATPVTIDERVAGDAVRLDGDRSDLWDEDIDVTIEAFVERGSASDALTAVLVDGDGNDLADAAVAASEHHELTIEARPCPWDDATCSVELSLELRTLDGEPVNDAYLEWSITAQATSSAVAVELTPL